MDSTLISDFNLMLFTTANLPLQHSKAVIELLLKAI